MKEFVVDIVAIFQFLSLTHWMYLVIGLPFTIFIVIFYFRNKAVLGGALINLIEWARPSLETNGKASTEKISVFVVMNAVYVPNRLIFTIKIFNIISNDIWHILVGGLMGSALDIIFILMLLKILSPQQLIELKSGLEKEAPKV